MALSPWEKSHKRGARVQLGRSGGEGPGGRGGRGDGRGSGGCRIHNNISRMWLGRGSNAKTARMQLGRGGKALPSGGMVGQEQLGCRIHVYTRQHHLHVVGQGQ